MNRLWVAAALAPLTFAAAQASAQAISADTNTPVVSNGETVTVNPGVTIGYNAGGAPGAQAAAITLNTSTTATPQGGETTVNSVSNQGAISATGLNYVTGVLVNGNASGVPGSIVNTGSITLNEATNYKDTNNDGIVDTNGTVLGQYAAGTNRLGIVTAGAPFVGGITNTGTISIIGENSAGIQIGPSGISGNLNNSGTISVTGGNSGSSDVSYGINALGPVGSVNLSGTITALGQNVVGVNLAGPITGYSTTSGTTTTPVAGSIEINGTITASGYRSTTASTVPSILALVQQQASSELLQGGPAVAIGGSVAGGVSIDPAIVATGTTAAVAAGSITSYGSAPALLIGGPSAITIGQYTSNLTGSPVATGYGLVLGGAVTGTAIYSFDSSGNVVNANAVQIGVNQVGSPTSAVPSVVQPGSAAVSIFGGIDLSGTVTATGIYRAPATTTTGGTVTPLPLGGTVTALDLGNVTVTNQATSTITQTSGSTTTITPYGSALNVTGTVSAGSTATGPVNVTAVQLDAQAAVPSLFNRGNIIATITGIPGVLNVPAAGGTQGYATAIRDYSGALDEVTNSGVISASITPIDPTQTVDTKNSRTIAIDLSANTNPGVTASVTQVFDPGLTALNAAGTSTQVVPTITGDVLFGAGNGVLNLQAGTLTGGMLFGNGAGNDIEITGGATATGPLAEDAGGQLKINVANGVLDITAPVTNPIRTSGSPAQFGTTQPLNGIGVSSLHVGSTGELILSVAGTNALITSPQLNVTGAVTFDNGGQLGLNFTSKLTQTTTYDLIQAGGQITLNNLSQASKGLGSLPYLYSAQISTANGQVDMTVTQKTAQQLGLNPAETSAFSAIYKNFDAADPQSVNEGSLATAMLGANNRSSFIKLYDQLLPDYSGGPFDDMVLGQQALARAEADEPDKLETDTTRGWVQEITYYNSRSDSSTINGYTGKGFGLAGGVERAAGHSAVGVAAAFVNSSIHDLARPDGSSNGADAIEAGVYWRAAAGGLNFAASANGGWSFEESRRTLLEQSGTDAATLYRLAKANWSGGIASASVSVSYKESFGRYYLKPEALADYVLLDEHGYTEHGGGDAFDLTINSKLNKEAIVQGDMVFGATYGTATRWSPELTVGYRDVVYGGPADTTAHFAGGPDFKLSPDYVQKGGVTGRIGVRASGNFADFNASAGGVFRSGYQTYDARAAARFLF